MAKGSPASIIHLLNQVTLLICFLRNRLNGWCVCNVLRFAVVYLTLPSYLIILLVVGFAGAEADKLFEGKGYSMVERERAKHDARREQNIFVKLGHN